LNPMLNLKTSLSCALLALVGALASGRAVAADEYYGTLEPFAKESIYFVLTDRYVNGDPGNDQRDQGGAHPTFDQPTPGGPPGESDNVGYLGGDFRGLLNYADDIRSMGFSAVWITPIVDNPNQAFTGGAPVAWKGFFTDRGKTGYHGYWGVNFFKLDEHLPSPGLDFAGLTKALRDKGLKVVLDIVANHGSPAFDMPVDQPMYGEIYDRDGKLIADHQNLPPKELDPKGNPLHRFFHAEPDLVQLSNIDETNPAVLEYFVAAYSQWIDQGAAAFRIDTIRHMPHAFWRQFSDRIRSKHPDFFMFGESFDYRAEKIATHTWTENGAISVLDFPLKEAIAQTFERPHSSFAKIAKRLYLQRGPYQNPYELMTFYDNHDMARMNATHEGFINANNFLFTARGIPVLYYGSETGFMRGTVEHAGNRNYFGAERIEASRQNPIRERLTRIAKVRAELIALQQGLQLNLEFKANRAAFLRVYQHAGVNQTALVLLNKGARSSTFSLQQLPAGEWRNAFGGEGLSVHRDGRKRVPVAANDVQVYVLDAAIERPILRRMLDRAMRLRLRADG